MNKDDNNNDKKKKQADDMLGIIGSMQKREPRRILEEDDILGVARAVQQPNMKHDFPIPGQDKSKLRKFLNQLDKDPDIDADYSNTPIFKIGHEDGYQEGHNDGYSEAYSELYAVLKAIETVIKPHIKSK